MNYDVIYIIYNWSDELDIKNARLCLDKIASGLYIEFERAEIFDKESKNRLLYFKNFLNKLHYLDSDDVIALSYFNPISKKILSQETESLWIDVRNRQLCLYLKRDETFDWRVNFDRFVKIVSEELTPIYGIAFGMASGNGARDFARGGGSFSMSDKLNMQSNMFGTTYSKVRKNVRDKLRDVFYLNIISDLHMLAPIEDMTFEQWVQEGDGDRGVIKKIKDHVWTWDVPREHILDIRKKLIEADMLIVTV